MAEQITTLSVLPFAHVCYLCSQRGFPFLVRVETRHRLQITSRVLSSRTVAYDGGGHGLRGIPCL